ncbi:hypothetical protein Bca52824_013141 [Brassica carinata]|uniref:C2H2-type domain-containing protein n=1 Tax=Brassica carinata TaxID=52824 RepID=A0A8X8B339_BRACI|nr:hypothetical protein Bca52824_013141 [Brassica carinata]
MLVRAEDNNTFDLNNLPDDPSIDFFPFYKEGSSSSSSSVGGFREKDIKDRKEYECRFCSLKFFKSQALGGHMNRHQRETESLNKARELVLRNNTFPPHQGPPSFSYHHRDLHIGDPITPYKPVMYPPRLFSPSALPPTPPPLVQPYLYPPGPPLSPTPLSLPYRRTNDYYLHNNGTHHQTLTNSGCGGRSPPESRYTFIGAPVANGSRVAPPLSQPLPPHHGYN